MPRKKKARPRLTSFGFVEGSKHLGLEVKPDGRVMAIADECANLMAPGENPYGDPPKARGPITAIPVVSCTNERPLAGLTPVQDALREFESFVAPTPNVVIPEWGLPCARCGQERVWESGTVGWLCFQELMDGAPKERQ